MAAPWTLWRLWKRRLQAVHVVPTVTVVTEKQLLLQKYKKKRQTHSFWFSKPADSSPTVVAQHVTTKKKRILLKKTKNFRLTSLSELPQRLQHLHSMHCQRYCLTDMIMLAVNCKQVGCPTRIEKNTLASVCLWSTCLKPTHLNAHNLHMTRALRGYPISYSLWRHQGRSRSRPTVERGVSSPSHGRPELPQGQVPYNCWYLFMKGSDVVKDLRHVTNWREWEILLMAWFMGIGG